MSAAVPTTDRIRLSIDGRQVEAEPGAYVLGVARGMGIEIPTLCDHPMLEPAAACRLCMVEVTHPDWGGWKGLMTSCLYPVAEGIEVSTASPAVLEARRRVLALQAARCPGSELIAGLAVKHGASTEHLQVDPEADDCILCGLCTRVCEAHATSAITTFNRGATKAVGAFAEAPPGDCVGCGACALVCPTGHIADERGAQGYEIWGRRFEVPPCTVERTRCVGCGACEEACPFAVARVAVRRGGQRVAIIPEEHCRGCGACVGACPTGAIDQEPYGWSALAPRAAANGRVTVYACGRADLGGRVPEGAHLVELPCTGRLSLPLLLADAARGASGVLVLGRQQETCRLNGAEDPVRDRVRRAGQALGMVGLGSERVRFEVPRPGSDGPRETVREFAAGLSRSPLREPAPDELVGLEGLDTCFDLLRWLSGREELEPDGAAWLLEHDLPAAELGDPVLFAGDLPYLSVLAGPLLAPVKPAEVLRTALAVLAELGHDGVGIEVAGRGQLAPSRVDRIGIARVVYALSPADKALLAASGVPAVTLDGFLLDGGEGLPRPAGGTRVACDGTPEQVAMIEALGCEAVDAGPDPLPEGFALSPSDRGRAEERLVRAEQAGATALLVPDALALARWALVAREGTWRSSRVTPVLAHQLAWLAISRVPLSLRSLEEPSLPALSSAASEVSA